jgi:hypothetical protein
MVSDKKIFMGISHRVLGCLVIPTSNQDGHQAKIDKRGDEIKKKNIHGNY